ncbi:MAG: 16S rRNA processing protein RimM [Acidobacteria bacterium]|nr:16S rRNA processing protein RimM [Acidobacteriota bacterium]
MASRSSTSNGSRSLPSRILVGRVRRAHGVRGELLISVDSDNPRRFDAGGSLYVAGGPARRILASRAHVDGLLLRLEGIDDRDAAEALRGADLEVERQAVPEAPAGTYYFYELIGCRCRDREAGDLGEIVDVVEDGGGLLLIAERDGRSLPIPFVEAFLRRVDVGAGELELELPAGLIETCTSES